MAYKWRLVATSHLETGIPNLLGDFEKTIQRSAGVQFRKRLQRLENPPLSSRKSTSEVQQHLYSRCFLDIQMLSFHFFIKLFQQVKHMLGFNTRLRHSEMDKKQIPSYKRGSAVRVFTWKKHVGNRRRIWLSRFLPQKMKEKVHKSVVRFGVSVGDLAWKECLNWCCNRNSQKISLVLTVDTFPANTRTHEHIFF